MSTKAVEDKVVHEAYLTPDPLAVAITNWVRDHCLPDDDSIGPLTVTEPSAGDGAFVRAVCATWKNRLQHVHANELRWECAMKLKRAGADTVTLRDWVEVKPKKPVDLVIGNPPFSLAERHFHHARSVVKPDGLIVFLLRMSFLGTQARAKTLWDKFPVMHFVPLAERVSYTGGEADNSEYAVYVWRKDRFKKRGTLAKPLWWRIEK